MEDEAIVGLFFERDETAVGLVREKYGTLLCSLARRLTGSESDAEECLNDALLQLWRNIPPSYPQNLRAYACQTVRNLAFKRLTHNLAKKRCVNSELPLDELEAVISDPDAELRLKNADFSVLLDSFLRGLTPESRVVFMKRYFFMDSVKEIAGDLGVSEAKVKSLLWRARNKLRKELLKGESQ